MSCRAIAIAAALIACSSEGSTPPTASGTDSSADIEPANMDGWGSPRFDSLPETPDSAKTEVATPFKDGADAPGDAPAVSVSWQAGAPGWTCEGDADCDSGLCAHYPDGHFACAAVCTAECSPGFACLAFPPRAGSFCVADHAMLCEPCSSDADCGGEPRRCLETGEEGSFCTAPCAPLEPCPLGWACEDKELNGVTEKLCARTAGVCPCQEHGVAVSAKTTCSRTSAYGTCAGTRQCSPSGLTPCSAQWPDQEICDGKDDDCDGQTDEDFVSACLTQDWDGDKVANGEDVCPIRGSLDQTDTDSDGWGDLCDYDDDGDGAADGDDCALKDATKSPGWAELCDGADNDCDALVDEEGAWGCKAWYSDKDFDGFGAFSKAHCLCAPDPQYPVATGGDCDDADATRYPGAPETLGDDLDSDCNGIKD